MFIAPQRKTNSISYHSNTYIHFNLFMWNGIKFTFLKVIKQFFPLSKKKNNISDIGFSVCIIITKFLIHFSYHYIS